MGLTMQDIWKPSSLDMPINQIRRSGTISGVFKPPETEEKDMTSRKAHKDDDEESLEHEMNEGDEEELLKKLLTKNPAMVQRVLSEFMKK